VDFIVGLDCATSDGVSSTAFPVKTNPHRAVIETRFARHAPAEVNGLKLKAVLAQSCSSLGNTCACNAFRSGFRSLNVELTKTRMTGRKRGVEFCWVMRAY
jgi:hypothetical protein